MTDPRKTHIHRRVSRNKQMAAGARNDVLPLTGYGVVGGLPDSF